MVSPSWPRDRTADAAYVPAVVTANIAAAAAAIGVVVVVAVIAAMEAAAVAAQGASVVGCDLDYRRGAWSIKRLPWRPRPGLHLQSRFGRRPHRRRLARGRRYPSSLNSTGSSSPKQSHSPGLSNPAHLSLHTSEPYREIWELGHPVL